METSYKKAGVDIEAGNKAVDSIKDLVKGTFAKNVLTGIGGFGGCYQFDFFDYEEPVLVSSADGVGTKLIVANLMNRHDTVGQCLVNHCTNDILCTGATPLYFLDYVGTGKLEQNIFHEIISGLTKACKENNCSLIGGETAEMPGIYQTKDYDLVGTITGIVDKKHILADRVKKHDVLIGLKSSGLHTNGYSLARTVLFEKHQVTDYVEEIGMTIGEALLAIHRSYLHPVKPLLKKSGLHAISHVTGGGIIGNTKRVVPENLQLNVNWNAWEWLPIFKYIQKLGHISHQEMGQVFNLGIGLILVAAPESVDEFIESLKLAGEESTIIGEVI
ncbi:MAG: phosphoribosylformylglycinamidine cyclo-ligase [Candidatus Marinimicrobia bacterium]|nr:phosphoribosylformylglycinamidine cyclo-ligase [Candidatus Neomarinimicrobiota bacterium]